MLRKLRRLSELSPGELLVFFQLILFALSARVALTFFALPFVAKFVARGTQNTFLRHFPLFQTRYNTTRLARLAHIAACITRPHGPCLYRSLLLFWLLKARGRQAQLLIGVSKEAGVLNSHAWIESKGRIVADAPEVVRRYGTVVQF